MDLAARAQRAAAEAPKDILSRTAAFLLRTLVHATPSRVSVRRKTASSAGAGRSARREGQNDGMLSGRARAKEFVGLTDAEAAAAEAAYREAFRTA
jgi:hypothetical protein